MQNQFRIYTDFHDAVDFVENWGKFFRKQGAGSKAKMTELISYEFIKVC